MMEEKLQRVNNIIFNDLIILVTSFLTYVNLESQSCTLFMGFLYYNASKFPIILILYSSSLSLRKMGRNINEWLLGIHWNNNWNTNTNYLP